MLRSQIDPGGRKKRRAQLERIGGFWHWEINDLTVAGRKRVIAVLEQHDRIQSEIQRRLPHAYDIAFHIEIAALLQRERDALASLLDRNAQISRSHQLRLIP